MSVFKKFSVFFLIGLALFLAGMFADFFWNARNASAPEPQAGIPLRVLNINESEERLYEINASYPHFVLLPESVNESIKSFVESHIAEFKKSARENRDARVATLPEEERKAFIPEPYYFSLTWSPAQISDKYVSFIVRTYSYEGGANGREEIGTWNYDVKQNREVTYRDLFPEEGDNYLEKLSKASRASLIGEFGFDFEGGAALEMLESGTEPTEENFRHFTFTDEAVTVYFEKYQVAPGSFGELRVVIPRVIVR